MIQQLKEVAKLLREGPSLGDDELFEMLVLRGIERRVAARLVEFFPMVCCRVLFDGSGARFPNVYQRAADDGTLVQHELSADPIWNEIMEDVRREVARGNSDADLRLIANRGVEYRSASQLLQNGSTLENIAFTPMIFKWPEAGPGLDGKRPPRSKWWPFGRSS